MRSADDRQSDPNAVFTVVHSSNLVTLLFTHCAFFSATMPWSFYCYWLFNFLLLWNISFYFQNTMDCVVIDILFGKLCLNIKYGKIK